MAVSGCDADADDGETVELDMDDPYNNTLFGIWCLVFDQWRTGPQGMPVGLDLGVLPPVFRDWGVRDPLVRNDLRRELKILTAFYLEENRSRGRKGMEV